MSTTSTDREQFFIDGRYRDGEGGDTHEVISPATGVRAGAIPVAVAADLDAAVTAAHAAQPAWAATNVWDRAEACHRIGDELAKRVDELARLQSLEQGKPLAESVADIEEAAKLFHLHAEEVAAKMDRHMADARERGAKILLGGGRRAGQPTDLYYEFTVVDDVPVESLLSREESFGPVVPIITGRSDDELLRLANDDKLGLQGAVFTRDMTAAFRFIENMEVGQVVVNESNNWWDINMPFGGAGARSTGWGRIGGKWTLLDMTDTRTGVISL